MSNTKNFYDLWKSFLVESQTSNAGLSELDLGRLFGMGDRPQDRLRGMRTPGQTKSSGLATKTTKVTEPGQTSLAIRKQGQLVGPEREKVVNALVSVSSKYDIDLQKNAIKADTDIIDVILSVMEQLCVVQKMNPIDWQNLSSEARIKMEPLKQDPDKLISFFEGVAEQIKQQGGIGVDCDQITTTQNIKQIQ